METPSGRIWYTKTSARAIHNGVISEKELYDKFIKKPTNKEKESYIIDRLEKEIKTKVMFMNTITTDTHQIDGVLYLSEGTFRMIYDNGEALCVEFSKKSIKHQLSTDVYIDLCVAMINKMIDDPCFIFKDNTYYVQTRSGLGMEYPRKMIKSPVIKYY